VSVDNNVIVGQICTTPSYTEELTKYYIMKGSLGYVYERNYILVDKQIDKLFSTRCERNQMRRLPICYLLGENSAGILDTAIELKRTAYGGHCSEMVHISTETLAEVMVRLINRDRSPTAIARISYHHLSNRIGTGRGISLQDLGRGCPNAVMITFSTRSGIVVQKYSKERHVIIGYDYKVIADSRITREVNCGRCY